MRVFCQALGNNRMTLQLHHGIVVIGFQRQIAVLGITFEEPSFLKKSSNTVTDSMHK